MSLVRVPWRTTFYPYSSGNSGTSFDYGGVLLDLDGEAGALVFKAPRTGDLKHFTWRAAAITTGGDVEASLETLNASAEPTGTLFDANCTAVTHNLTATGPVTTSFTNACPVNAGDLLAFVVRRPTGSAFAGSVLRYGEQAYQFDFVTGFPTLNTYNTGAWVRTAWGRGRYMVVEYSDNWCWTPGAPTLASTATASWLVSTDSTYKAVGCCMQLPDCEVDGLTLMVDADGDLKAELYNDEGVLLRTSATFTAAGRLNSYRCTIYLRVEPIRLRRGYYYVIARPTTTTDFGTLTVHPTGSQDVNWRRDIFGGIRNVYSTSGNPPFTFSGDTHLPICAGVQISALYVEGGSARTRPRR